MGTFIVLTKYYGKSAQGVSLMKFLQQIYIKNKVYDSLNFLFVVLTAYKAIVTQRCLLMKNDCYNKVLSQTFIILFMKRLLIK